MFYWMVWSREPLYTPPQNYIILPLTDVKVAGLQDWGRAERGIRMLY